MKINSAVFDTHHLWPLFVRADIRPDVFVGEPNTGTALQFEVHSCKKEPTVYNEDDYQRTIRKLGHGLAEQFR